MGRGGTAYGEGHDGLHGHRAGGAVDAVKLDVGDLVATTLVVENQGASVARDRGDAALENIYRGLSDEPPTDPRLVRSRHFAFLTDVSDREWAVIRDKLERMVANLERFFGRRSTGVVEGFIVREPAGTWQDYAWRWALCHLLANNPNYADRFRPLAIALMEEQPGASFEATYGPVARELSFEYEQFLEAVGTGYQTDLTAWPWKAKFRPLAAGGTVKATFTAPASGQLFLRCADDWTQLADNEGEIAVAVRRP